MKKAIVLSMTTCTILGICSLLGSSSVSVGKPLPSKQFLYASNSENEVIRTVNLGNINAYAYNTPFEIFAGELESVKSNGKKWAYIYNKLFITKLMTYTINSEEYSTFKIDALSQYVPGVATTSLDGPDFEKKYYNVSMENSMYVPLSHTNKISLIDYWPQSSSDLELPQIIVTENHTQTVSLGISSDISQGVELSAFGLKADREVSLGLNGNYTSTYTVTHQYTITDPKYFDAVLLSQHSGFCISIDEFSSDKSGGLKTNSKSFTLISGGVFDVKKDSDGYYNGAFNYYNYHMVGSKNIFGYIHFKTGLEYETRFTFRYQ